MVRWIARALLFRVLPRRVVPALAMADLALMLVRARRDRRARAKRVLESGDERPGRSRRPA